MDVSPAVGIIHSFSPQGSPSPPTVSGDDAGVKLDCHVAKAPRNDAGVTPVWG